MVSRTPCAQLQVTYEMLCMRHQSSHMFLLCFCWNQVGYSALAQVSVCRTSLITACRSLRSCKSWW
jgi:hypothetical protein